MRTPGLHDALYLVNKGVPYDVAMNMPDDQRFAFVVAFGELDGGEYDWSARSWRKRS